MRKKRKKKKKEKRRNKSLFITGTDTGVGKTFITIHLAKALISKGKDVAIVKPVSTGTIDTDPQRYQKIKGVSQYNLYSFRLPLSPYQATQNERKKLDFNRLIKWLKKITTNHEVTLIEGIGGALVPLTKNHYAYEFATKLNIPSIIVTTPWLGTMNHTFLTTEFLKKNRVELKGIVINKNARRPLNRYHRQLKQIFNRLTGVKTYGIVHYGKRETKHFNTLIKDLGLL